MRYITKITSLLFIVLALTSCIKEPSQKFEEIEQLSLKAWIEKYHPELLDNYQEDGGYYVEVLDEGVLDSLPITGEDVWMWYDFTGRSLNGTICETRSYALAEQLGTFTTHTHYAPAYRFSGEETHTMTIEGTHLATFNELTIDGESFKVRYGTELRLYLPSTIAQSDTGTSGDGGYEGQYSLDGNKPMIVDLKIWGHVANPVAYEANRVDSFANINGGLCDEHKSAVENESTTSSRRRYTRTEEEGENEEVDTRPLEFFDGRWHQPNDTLAHLYVNYAYSPARQVFDYKAIGQDTLMYPHENTYQYGRIYGSATMEDIDRRINEALVERFGEGISYDEVLTTDSLNTKSVANVWYIGRFLDGFIFDTNIDEVKEIVFGEVASKGEALAFEMADPLENDYILAWNYAIPTLRIGQWATILTSSTYGYGIAGVAGSHTSTTTSNNDAAYYDYLNYYNYMNYMNSYYGYGYGNAYNNGYYGYNPYYYGYTPTIDTSTSTTVTTTSTEIPAYSPLIFQVFVK